MVYVHTPARYVWTRTFDARGNNPAARVVSHVLRPLDRSRAREGAEFAANSAFVRRRIRDTWGVDARVIYPPVHVERIQSVRDWRDRLDPAEAERLAALPEGFVLGASRFIPYKRLQDVIKVGEATGMPVVLAVGARADRPWRRRRPRPRCRCTSFRHRRRRCCTRSTSRQRSSCSRPIEDFGIMPVEAMAAGAPVLAMAEGGVTESVLPGVTGALIHFSSPDEMRDGTRIALATSRSDRVDRAKEFAACRFRKEIVAWVNER